MCVCAHAKLIQSCPAVCNPMDYSPPGSFVHGDSPGKNTGVGCPALLHGIFLTQGWNPGLLHCRQNLYPLSHQGTWINFVGIQFPAELQRHCLLSSSIRLLESLVFHCRFPSGNCVFYFSHENVSRGGGFFFFFNHSFSWVFLTGRCLEPWEFFFYHVMLFPPLHFLASPFLKNC